MASHSHLQSTSFHLVLEKYKASLSEKEKCQFAGTTIQDLQIAIKKIQDEQTSSKKLQGMRRLERFLEGMKEYDKVISIFVNSSQILAFVWGPMKFLLQTACTFSEAFDTLVDAYERIGEHLPLMTQYEQHFRNSPRMASVLRYMYEDILAFHWKAMRYFRQKVWKQLFHAVWRTFNAEFKNILENLQQHRQLIESQAGIEEYAAIIKAQELTADVLKKQEDEEHTRRREGVCQWLAPAAYDVDHESFAKVRHDYPSTGEWLLKADRFHSWFDPDFCSNHLLWLTGIPGAGKTVLASLVIDEARKLVDTAVAFFYCKYQDVERNTSIAVIRGVLAQLLHQFKGIDLLAYFFDEKSKSGQPTLLTNILARKLLSVAARSHKKLYIVIDGIDECDSEQRKEIVATFEDLWDSLPSNDKDTLRCLFISQDDRAARKDFSRMVSLRITEDHLKNDIQAYAKVWSSKIQTQFQLPYERQRYIEDMITERAEGMFLYAKLMSYHLCSQTSLRALDHELSPNIFPHGPSRLEEVYGRITSRLFDSSNPYKSAAIKVLSWLVCARRPLRWHEIQCAVSIDIEDSAVQWEEKRFRVDHKDLCGPLVDIRRDQTLTLVHHTVKRYLAEKSMFDTAVVDGDLAYLCTGYLTLPCFELVYSTSALELWTSSGYFGFLDYAYAYWSHHLQRVFSVKDFKKTHQELVETVSVFVEMHWSSPIKVAVPKSLVERLKPLQGAENFEQIAAAVQYSRTRLLSSASPSLKLDLDQQEAQLEQVLARVRSALEQFLSAVTNPRAKERFQQMYGLNYFKCPRVNCIWFYNGFSTKEKRDDHVERHDRAYFCSFSGCHISQLGCATLKELQKHEVNYHKAMGLEGDEEDEFPEPPPEKISFDCQVCGASFTRKHTLKNHTRIKHSNSTTEKFLCSTCGKDFVRQGDRTRHEATAHSNASKFVCGGTLSDGTSWGCGREFNRGDTLNRHWQSEKGKACLSSQREVEETLQGSTLTPQTGGTGTPVSSQ